MLFVKNNEMKSRTRPFLKRQLETTFRKGLYKWFGFKKKMSVNRSKAEEPNPAYMVLPCLNYIAISFQ